jgi:hypothetical protein
MNISPSDNKGKLRKTWLINPRFQLRFIFFMLFTSLASLGIFYATVKYFYHSSTRLLLDAGFALNHPVFRLLEEQQQRLGSYFLVTIAAVIGFSMFFGIIFSHQVAGPMYHLHKHLLELAGNKNLPPLKFRKNDYFQEICDAFEKFRHSK